MQGRQMKKVIAVLFVILILIGGYYTWNTLNEVTAENVSYVIISDPFSGQPETYYPGDIDIKSLLDDLEGKEITSFPKDTTEAYGIKIVNSWGREKNYSIYFDKNQKYIYINDIEAEKSFLVDKPAFLSIHEEFTDLYDFRVPPSVTWTSSIEGFAVMETSFQWQYQKWDGSWHESVSEQLPQKGKSAPAYTIESSDIELCFASDYAPDSILLEVSSETGDILLKKEMTDYSIPVMNVISDEGLYTYAIRLDWGDPGKPYKGSYSCSFALCLDIPPEFKIVSNQVTQGELIEIRAYHINEDEKPFIKQQLSEDARFFKVGEGSYVSYIPTGYYINPGVYEIELGVERDNAVNEGGSTAKDGGGAVKANDSAAREGVNTAEVGSSSANESGNTTEGGGSTVKEVSNTVNESSIIVRDKITVAARKFLIQYLYIDEAIEASTRNDEAYVEYDKYFGPVRKTSHDEAYYTESFVIPAKGRLSTEYGETRYVNDSPTSYRHSGLDIGAPTGTPIYAANTGKVVLARYLIMTGNTIVIDHGLGLFSVYFHMDKLWVEQGDMVERGQQIGEMGSTGFSTGPHLHLTMSYYETNIEPGYILVGEPITKVNYKNYLE
jgi:murein DD-endopeptidase MepM/ murein hydrolase activator NlpD